MDILSGIKADIFFCAIHCVKHDLSLARNCTSHLKALSVCCDLKLELWLCILLVFCCLAHYMFEKKKKDYTHSQEDCSYSSLSLIVFLLFAVHFHQKPTPLQLATISQHSMTWWDTMRADEIHTLGLSVLDNNVSTRLPWEWRDAPSFCYSIFNASQPF